MPARPRRVQAQPHYQLRPEAAPCPERLAAVCCLFGGADILGLLAVGLGLLQRRVLVAAVLDQQGTPFLLLMRCRWPLSDPARAPTSKRWKAP